MMFARRSRRLILPISLPEVEPETGRGFQRQIVGHERVLFVVDQSHVPARHSAEKPFGLIVVDERHAHLIAQPERTAHLVGIVDVTFAQPHRGGFRHP